jgi:hypothetical protein
LHSAPAMLPLRIRQPGESSTWRESGWFIRCDEPLSEEPASAIRPVSTAAPQESEPRFTPAREECELIGVVTSRARRYSYIAPRGGRKLGQR